MSTIDGLHGEQKRSKTPRETVEFASQMLEELGEGIFDGLREVGHLDSMGLPIYKVLARERYNEWGKGISVFQSQASAVMERVERISSVPKHRDAMPKIISSYFKDIAARAVPRSAFGSSPLHHLLYGKEGIDGQVMDWVEAQSLSSGKDLLVPAQCAYFRYPSKVADSLCTTGIAAGNTNDEARLQALCEVIERHIFHRMIYNRPKVRSLDLSTVKNPALLWLISFLQRKGYTILANDFSDGWSIPSVSAFIFHPREKTIFQSYLKCGTAPDPEIALIRAITESAQTRAVYIERGNVRFSQGGFFKGASQENLEANAWLLGSQTIGFDQLPSLKGEDAPSQLQDAIEGISSKGHDVLYCDLTHPRMKIPVARMLIPGIQPNFTVRGLHHLDKRSCVTPHLSVYGEVLQAIEGRKVLGQDLDLLVPVRG